MRFSYNWIKEYVKLTESASRAADALTMHSFSVEGVAKNGRDYVFDVEILPNRMSDAASHVGIAREFAAIFKKRFAPPSPQLREDATLLVSRQAAAAVKEPELCGRYTARVIHDVKVGESPAWLKDRLEAVGVRPINNIVDAANYVMLELGQPIHAFDLDKVQSQSIIVRMAKAGETIETLDGEHVALDTDDLVIADTDKPLAIAGVKGGMSSGVSTETKNILLEAAIFDRGSIRRTSQRHNLRTDAAVRFAAGLSAAHTVPALDRVAEIIIETGGGRIARGLIDVMHNKPSRHALSFSLDELSQFVGAKIPRADAVKILTSLGFEVRERGKEKGITVIAPSIRLDIECVEDVFEEIARLYGYGRIMPDPFRAPLYTAPPPEKRRFRDKAKDVLSAIGFFEVITYAFTSKAGNGLSGLPADKQWEIENPSRSDRQFLRQSIIPGLFEVLRSNMHLADRHAFFEVGTTYHKNDGKPEERTEIALLLWERSPDEAHQAFYTLKGLVEAFLDRIDHPAYWFDNEVQDSEVPPVFDKVVRAVIRPEDTDNVLGVIGEVNRETLNGFDIEGHAVIALFDADVLKQIALRDRFYQEIPKFPPLKRDIAFLVSTDVRVLDAENAIWEAGGEHLSDVELFDVYEELGNEQKSMAFHLIFQSGTETLTRDDVEEDFKNIEKALIEKFGATIR